MITDTFGTHRVKLPAGDLILYPGTSLHRVVPVTRGVRLASFFWIESMVREDSQRQLLFDLDTAIQELAATIPENQAVDRLLNVYHNLLPAGWRWCASLRGGETVPVRTWFASG